MFPTKPENGKGPPTGIDASELFARLTTMPRPHTVVPFPRKVKDGEAPMPDVAIFVLTESELMRARVAASQYAAALFAKTPNLVKDGETGYEIVRQQEQVIELLVIACRDPKNLKFPAFPNAELARKYVTSDEWAVLLRAYTDWQLESGPIMGDLTVQEMDDWLDRLEEGAASVPLSVLSSGALEQLLKRSVSRLRKSRAASGSPGSEPVELSSGASPLPNDPESTSSEEQQPPPPSVSEDEVPPLPENMP
jgi:hypothetical protein